MARCLAAVLRAWLVDARRRVLADPGPWYPPSAERDGFLHNAVAHPLLVLAPRTGRRLHQATSPVVPSLRCRLDRARELDHAAGRSRWWDPGRCR